MARIHCLNLIYKVEYTRWNNDGICTIKSIQWNPYEKPAQWNIHDGIHMVRSAQGLCMMEYTWRNLYKESAQWNLCNEIYMMKFKQWNPHEKSAWWNIHDRIHTIEYIRCNLHNGICTMEPTQKNWYKESVQRLYTMKFIQGIFKIKSTQWNLYEKSAQRNIHVWIYIAPVLVISTREFYGAWLFDPRRFTLGKSHVLRLLYAILIAISNSTSKVRWFLRC